MTFGSNWNVWFSDKVPKIMPPRTGDGEMMYVLKKKSRDRQKRKEMKNDKQNQKSKFRKKYLRKKEEKGTLSKDEKKELKNLCKQT